MTLTYNRVYHIIKFKNPNHYKYSDLYQNYTNRVRNEMGHRVALLVRPIQGMTRVFCMTEMDR